MNLLLLALAALAVVPKVLGQDASSASSSALQAVEEMPACARACLVTAIDKSHCDLTNTTCICTNPVMQQTMQACVLESCTIKQALATMNLTAVGCDQPIRDRSRAYIILNDVFGTVSGIFVLQRVAYKIWSKVGLGGDDLMATTTVIIGIPSTVISAYKVTDHGLGRDIWTLTPSQITNFGLYFWVMEILYFLEVSMLKLSLVLFYIRIFPGKTVRAILWTTFASCAAFGLSFALVAVFQCTPVKFYWEKWDGEHHGTCLNINSIAWSNAAISIAIDIWVLAIPLWQLKGLNLDWRRKVGVGMMFCIGAFVTVVSILRLRSLIKFGSDSLNPTWDFFDVSIWSVVEINVGLVCVCLPSFRVLLVRVFPKLQGTTERYGRSSRRNRSSNKRTSRLPLGHSAGSQVDKSMSHPNVGPNRIAFHRSYTVEYGDTDEVQLVSMNDKQSAKSDARSDTS
ncbi:putative PTH11-typeG-protein-coupled receptor [Trichoderma austrokoningii]